MQWAQLHLHPFFPLFTASVATVLLSPQLVWLQAMRSHLFQVPRTPPSTSTNPRVMKVNEENTDDIVKVVRVQRDRVWLSLCTREDNVDGDPKIGHFRKMKKDISSKLGQKLEFPMGVQNLSPHPSWRLCSQMKVKKRVLAMPKCILFVCWRGLLEGMGVPTREKE